MPRIGMCIADDDLRVWVLEELLLVSWLALPAVERLPDLTTLDAIDVLVVGAEKLSEADRDRLRTRTWATPIIAIGTIPDVEVTYVLSPRLTSRELKTALRASLLDSTRARASVVG